MGSTQKSLFVPSNWVRARFIWQISSTHEQVQKVHETPKECNLRIPRAAAAAAKSLQSCLTLCDPTDGSPPGSPIPGILQARTLEWVAISFSNAWKWKVKVKSLSHVRLLATSWTAAYQAPPSMGFSRQEYWSGVPLPSPISRAMHFKLRMKSSLISYPNHSWKCTSCLLWHVAFLWWLK